jgi:hypothetical protein
MGVHAVYPSRKFVSPKVRLMIEFLVNAFRDACLAGVEGSRGRHASGPSPTQRRVVAVILGPASQR